jgi:hypothetical protein
LLIVASAPTQPEDHDHEFTGAANRCAVSTSLVWKAGVIENHPRFAIRCDS